MNLTEVQERIINATGKNMLVSAAAGSGKTFVLVERIKKLVTKGHRDIDSFLITTFTKAASEEMKKRIEEAIMAELSEPGVDRQYLRRQLSRLPGASICTFHSFAIDTIRQYFYLTDLQPGFGICDDTQKSILITDSLDEVFAAKYEEDSEEFTDFLMRRSSDRSDFRLKEEILETYKVLRSIPDYMTWAENAAEALNSESPSKALGLESYIRDRIRTRLKEAAILFDEAAEVFALESLKGTYAKVRADADMVAELTEKAESAGDNDEIWEEIRSFLEKPGYQRMGLAAGDSKEDYNELKDAMNRLRSRGKDIIGKLGEKYCSSTPEEYDLELKAVYGDTKYFISIIRDFEAVLKAKKAELNVIDFDDAMHYVIQILNDETAAAELRDRYELIFVDEYQDSNLLQEEILGKICRDNNMFMVGDVKQSIYKFRLAEPELFLSKAASYGSGEDPNSELINLSRNYRSKKNITETVNAVFSRIMEGYDDNAMLHCSIDEEYPGWETTLHIINQEDQAEETGTRAEMEAAIAAEIIRDCLGKEIYDVKAKAMRKIRPRDIAVLSRGGAEVAVTERYLNNENIPAYGETGEGYFESVEIQVFLNILRIIDNMQQDVPLISAMRSVVFGFSIRDLTEIRLAEPEGSFAFAVAEYGEKGENAEIRNRIVKMRENLDVWKEIEKTVPLDEFVRMIMYDTGYYDYCSGLPVGHQRVSNLRLIVEKASGFEELNYGGLHGFLEYVEAMDDSNVSEAEAKTLGEGEDVVRVMTVHKSKGLEFPVVILTGTGKEIRGGKGSTYVHKSFGIGLPYVDTERHTKTKTLLQNVISGKMGEENLDEEKRILYVALTRAMDRLEIIGSIKTSEKLKEEGGDKTYLEMVYPAISSIGGNIHFCSDLEVSGLAHHAGATAASLLERLGGTGDSGSGGADGSDGSHSEQYREIDRRLSFEYPHASDQEIRAKYSVSQLNSRGGDVTINISSLKTDEEDGRVTPADLGTAMHLVMEKADFAKAKAEGIPYITELADSLAKRGAITAAERGLLNLDSIASFFDSEVGSRAVEAQLRGELYKEKEFIYEKDMSAFASDGSGDSASDGPVTAVVQGIIDCYFIEDGEIVLVDYKNSYVSSLHTEEDIRETYRGQIELYREALQAATDCRVKESYLYLFEIGRFIDVE